VAEEVLVARAEVVESGLAVGCLDEAVFRAAAVAGKADAAFAVPRLGLIVKKEPPVVLSDDTHLVAGDLSVAHRSARSYSLTARELVAGSRLGRAEHPVGQRLCERACLLYLLGLEVGLRDAQAEIAVPVLAGAEVADQ
jgi:hypothetical protein